MKESVLTAICVTMIIALFGSGCIAPPESENNLYYYSITLKAQQPNNYTIYAPFVFEQESNYTMEKLLSSMYIGFGKGQFNLIQTEYGPALKIDSNDSINLVSEYMDADEYHSVSLSMRSNKVNDDTMEHWISCEADHQGELEVSIYLHAEAGSCCGEIRTEETEPIYQIISTEGWQKISTLFTIIE